jgi:hypothetical protein
MDLDHVNRLGRTALGHARARKYRQIAALLSSRT